MYYTIYKILYFLGKYFFYKNFKGTEGRYANLKNTEQKKSRSLLFHFSYSNSIQWRKKKIVEFSYLRNNVN